MKKIKKIRIENFQSHEYTELEFSEGLTVIVGPSDQGKSAIIRAIKWVLFNEPRGTDFIRIGASTARVEITLDNQCKIIRERSKTKNRYHVVFSDGNEKTFEGFGNEVPQEVSEVHGIRKIQIDQDTAAILTISEQLEGPFLLSSTGSTRAKAIGRLVGAHIIDRAIRDSVTDLRRSSQLVERIQADLEENKEQLKEFENLGEIEKGLIQSEHLLKKTETGLYKYKKLHALYENMKGNREEEEELQERMIELGQLDQLEQHTAHALSMLKNWRRVDALYDKLQSIDQELSRGKEIMNKTGAIRESTNIIEDMQEKVARLELISGHRGKLRDVIRRIHLEEEGLHHLETQSESLLQDYSQTLRHVGVCPLCRSEITQEKIKEILAYYKEVHYNVSICGEN